MAMGTTDWPRKTRELHTPLLDSSMWNGFRFRPDDVVIATYGKAGTTWTQQRQCKSGSARVARAGSPRADRSKALA
jgi:hypothetical protein